jgi:hypothetical protein
VEIRSGRARKQPLCSYARDLQASPLGRTWLLNCGLLNNRPFRYSKKKFQRENLFHILGVPMGMVSVEPSEARV